MIVCGLDISSQRIDCCTLREDGPPLLGHLMLGKRTSKLNDRLRCVGDAVDRLTRVGEGLLEYVGGHYERPDWIAIEEVYRNPSLLRAHGAIVASCPPMCKVKVVTPWEWRKALGCTKDTKEQGHLVVTAWLIDNDHDLADEYLNEHELDCIGVALGARAILEQQDVAA